MKVVIYRRRQATWHAHGQISSTIIYISAIKKVLFKEQFGTFSFPVYSIVDDGLILREAEAVADGGRTKQDLAQGLLIEHVREYDWPEEQVNTLVVRAYHAHTAVFDLKSSMESALMSYEAEVEKARKAEQEKTS